MDIISPEQRSALMSRIKFKDTQIELQVRRGLHALGLRFRLGENYKEAGSKLPGRPDVVLPKFRTVIFVHGCFWHGHHCHLFRLPKTRAAFWKEKITANQERDARKTAELRKLGWRVEHVWECQLRDVAPESRASMLEDLVRRIESRTGA